MRKLTLFFGAALFIWGCNSDQTSKEQNAEVVISEDSLAKLNSQSPDAEFDKVFESIPSPLEFTSLIKNTGAKYSETFLNKSENASKYNSQYSKAINLGIYGADLGYINLYQKTFSTMGHLNTVFQLATDLNIGEYFDFNTLKRLATNNKNVDSLVFITTKGFERMHHQLKKTSNSQVSVLIMTGGWIEGLHLTTEIIKLNKNAQVKELMLTVYDEHIVLDDLLILLNRFKSDPNIANLIVSLEKLKTTYSKIVALNENKEATISQDQFNELANEIELIREKLIE